MYLIVSDCLFLQLGRGVPKRTWDIHRHWGCWWDMVIIQFTEYWHAGMVIARFNPTFPLDYSMNICHAKLWRFPVRDLFWCLIIARPITEACVFTSSSKVWWGKHEPCAAMDGQSWDPRKCCHSWHWHWKWSLSSWTGVNRVKYVLKLLWLLFHGHLVWVLLKGQFTKITTNHKKYCNICGLDRVTGILL